MTSDHEALSRALEDLKQKISETHRVVMSLEISVTHRAEGAEEALDAYNNLLTSLGLFPPLPAPFEDVNLTLELNTAASTPQQLVLGADIRKIIKPTLSGIAESKRSQRALVESERDRVDHELDQLTLECENVDEEIGELEKKVNILNEQAEDYRDVRVAHSSCELFFELGDLGGASRGDGGQRGSCPLGTGNRKRQDGSFSQRYGCENSTASPPIRVETFLVTSLEHIC